MLTHPPAPAAPIHPASPGRWFLLLGLLTLAACKGCGKEPPPAPVDPTPEAPQEKTSLSSEDVCTRLLAEGLRTPDASVDFLDLSIAGDADTTWVAWAEQAIQVSRWSGEGPWRPLPTAPGAELGAARPSLAQDAAGRLLMAWEEDQDSGTGIRVATFDGEAWQLLGGSVGAYAGQGTPASDPVLLGGSTPVLFWTEVERGHAPTQGSSGEPGDFPDDVMPEAVPDLLPAERAGQSLWGAWWDGNRWSSGRAAIARGSDLVSFETHAFRDRTGRPWVTFVGGSEATETFVRVARLNDEQVWEDVGGTAGAFLKSGGEVHAPRLVSDGEAMWVQWREGTGPRAPIHFARWEKDTWSRPQLALPVPGNARLPAGPSLAETAPGDVWAMWTEAVAEGIPTLRLAVMQADRFERVGSELGQGPEFSGVRSFALSRLGEGALGVVWDAEREGRRSVHVARLEACQEGQSPLSRIVPREVGDAGSALPAEGQSAAEGGDAGPSPDAGPDAPQDAGAPR